MENKISEEKAKNLLVWELVKNNVVPIELFNNLKILAKKSYSTSTIWHLYGKIGINWNCIKVIKNPHYHWLHNPNVKEADYIPIQGGSSSNFSIEVFATDEDDAWREAEYKIKSIAEKRISEDLTRGYEYTDIYFNFYYLDKSQYKDEERNPYWDLFYEYEGKKYKCRIDGKNGNLTRFTHPSKKQSNSNSKQEKKEIATDIIKRLDNPISMTVFGWSCFFLTLIASVLGLYAITQQAQRHPGTLIPSIILCALLLLLAIVFGVNMSFRQDKENELKSKCKSLSNSVYAEIKRNQKQLILQDRCRCLLAVDNPLLNPLRGKLKDAIKNEKSDAILTKYEQALSLYRSKLRKDKFVRFIYSIILLLLLVLIPISFWKFSLAFDDEWRIRSTSDTTNETTYESSYITIDDFFLSPNLLFNISNNKIGHFRQDLRKTLLNLGYTKNNDSNSMIGESFVLYDKMGSQELVWVFINTNNTTNDNFEDDIHTVDIKIKEEYVDAYFEKYRKALIGMGFVEVQDDVARTDIGLMSNSYLRVGKRMITSSFLYPKSQIAKWDAVEFKDYEKMIHCYSVDDISEMPSYQLQNYKELPIDMNDNNLEEELRHKYNPIPL